MEENNRNKNIDEDRPIPMVLTDFEAYLRRTNKADSTIYNYMCCIKKYFKEGNKINVPENYIDFIYKYMNENTRSTYYYDVIVKFLNWVDINKDIKRLTLKTLPQKKYFSVKKETLILTHEQRMDIINNLNSYKHQIIGLIQEECGVRAGDVLKLKRGSIDYGVDESKGESYFFMKIRFIQKGNKYRIINIYNKEAIERIQEFIRNKYLDKEFYFCERKFVRNPYDNFRVVKRNYDLYWKDLQITCKRLSYEPSKFTSHDIRRNFAGEMFNILDQNIVELQRVMGHSDINTTLRYLRQQGLSGNDALRKRSIRNN